MRDLIAAAVAALLLIIAAYVSARRGAGHGGQATTAAEPIDDRPEGIARDRWDVTIEAIDAAALVVECGSIRERVSQELARAVFDAVKHDLERRDA